MQYHGKKRKEKKRNEKKRKGKERKGFIYVIKFEGLG